MNPFRKAVPWWLRIAVKIVLSRLPIPYSFWKRLHLFEHGDMNEPSRALENFLYHCRSAHVLYVDEHSSLPYVNAGNDFNVLELGPGDSLFTILIAKTLGASKTFLVDAAPFATTNMAAYREMLDYLRQKGFDLSFASMTGSLDDLLKQCNGEYLTNGVASLAQIPSSSIDFCFSHTVLQHIPKSDFPLLVTELYRLLKSGRNCLHRVDLRDCIGGGLNNLRFSEQVWEGELFRKSGFYTNRIRFNEMISMFERTGFHCSILRKDRWEKLPILRKQLAAPFSTMADSELLVKGFDILLKK